MSNYKLWQHHLLLHENMVNIVQRLTEKLSNLADLRRKSTVDNVFVICYE